MISKDSLHIGWISKVSSANRKADKILVEKVIRALLLLEGLVKQTFENFATTELEYRNQTKLTISDVLDDIYQTSLCLVSRGADGKGDFYHLQTGIQRVSRFIFSESFHIDRAITLASKAAYISSLIKSNKAEIEKFKNPAIMKDWTIGPPFWPKLNRLKKSNPEAFFYWYKIFELTTD